MDLTDSQNCAWPEIQTALFVSNFPLTLITNLQLTKNEGVGIVSSTDLHNLLTNLKTIDS